MPRSFIGRLVIASAFAVLSLLMSPIGIKLITGREDLTFRVNLVGLCFAAFLLVLAIAIASIGRLRQLMFYVLAIMLPAIFLAVLETAAIAVHLADRVALAEDNSVYDRPGRWPAHLMSDARMINTDGLRLYRPWQGDGVVINDLGLRTQRPQTKQPGEWRIALTGGSTAWGYRIGDEDTIAAQLSRVLQRRGYKNVSVYNFGIEGVELKSELALLMRFREIYAIDQVIFYTGGNDVIGAYMDGRPWPNQATGFTSLELFKAWTRLAARLNSPATNLPDARDRSQTLQSNSLSVGIVAATEYCRTVGLKCDFALQPWLFTRAHPAGTESAMRRSIEIMFPGLYELWSEMYASALTAEPADRVHDLRNALDTVDSQVFADLLHINETGNSAIGKRLEPIAAHAIPSAFRQND
jgi:lysophospholipase L1-like esterase